MKGVVLLACRLRGIVHFQDVFVPKGLKKGVLENTLEPDSKEEPSTHIGTRGN